MPLNEPSTRENFLRTPLMFALYRYIYMGIFLHAHLVHGESHIQHKTNREVATPAAILG